MHMCWCPQYLVSFRVNDNMLISRKRITGFLCLSKCYFQSSANFMLLNYVGWNIHLIKLASGIIIYSLPPLFQYWVSQGNKWCDFCKIYIANNPFSIRTHEVGKRHKDNVTKRLSTMQKETETKEKEQQQAARALQQIEAVSSQIHFFPLLSWFYSISIGGLHIVIARKLECFIYRRWCIDTAVICPFWLHIDVLCLFAVL